MQKHSLVEADINVLGERVKQVVQHSQRFLEEEAVEGYQPCDPSIIVDRVSGICLYSVKNLSKFVKTFLKEEAAKGYQPCDP